MKTLITKIEIHEDTSNYEVTMMVSPADAREVSVGPADVEVKKVELEKA